MAAASCETGSSVGLLFVEVCLRAGIPPGGIGGAGGGGGGGAGTVPL